MLFAVLAHQVLSSSGIVVKGAGLVSGEADLDVLCRLSRLRSTVLRKRLEVIPIAAVLHRNLALIQILQDLLSGGDQAVLITVVFPSLRVPPEDLGVASTPDPVHMVHFPAPQVGIRLLAAAGMNVNRVVSQGQLHKVGTRGPDAAHRFDALHRLIERQHPGNAALHRDLINHIRLTHPDLRQGLAQVVHHDGKGPGKSLPGPLFDPLFYPLADFQQFAAISQNARKP